MPPSTWNTPTGQRTRRPGVYSDIDATALAGVGPAARGGVALLLEAPTLAPQTVYSASNAGAFKRYVPDPLGTPLAKCLFNPSTDPKVPSGARLVKIVNVAPSTQASLTVQDAVAHNAMTLKSAKYGAGGNNIQAKLEAGTVSGKKVTVTNGVLTETKDNITVDTDVLGLGHTDAITDGSVTAHVTEKRIDPNGTLGAGGDAGVLINQQVKIAASHTWTLAAGDSVAFDGAITFTQGVEIADKDYIVIGINKATGLADTETVTITAGLTSGATTKTWSSVTSIEVQDALPVSTTVTVDWYAFDLPIATYDTIAKVVARVQQKTTQGFAAAAKIGTTTFPIASLDYDNAAVALPNVGTEVITDAQLYYLITAINANFSLLTAERATSAWDIPANFAYTNLTGGTDGVATNTDWEDALALLKTETGISHVNCLTTLAAVHTLLGTHLDYMSGAGRDERIGFVGLPKQTNKGTVQSLIAAINNRNITPCINDIDLYDYTGTQINYGPEYWALMVTAMDAGRRNENSLTWTYPSILDAGDNADDAVAADAWNADDDAEDLLSYGALFLSKNVANGLWRIERDVTSYLVDDNPIFTSVYANESANFSTKNVRRAVEAVIGGGNFTGTAGGVKEIVATELQRQVDNNEIKAFLRSTITVTDAGDGLDIDYQVAVTEAVYFINQTAHVVRVATSA